jgi:hypothetical protein
MAKIEGHPSIGFTITLQLNEAEARALEALTGYGTHEFLSSFYANMGKHYLQPYEAGLVSLFETVKTVIPKITAKIDAAKEAFDK